MAWNSRETAGCWITISETVTQGSYVLVKQRRLRAGETSQGFIVQVVGQRTGIAEFLGSNVVVALETLFSG